MSQPACKKRKLNRHLTVRENADNLYRSDPYNVELWMHIISRADKQASHDDQGHILDLFLSIFPTSAREWKYYIRYYRDVDDTICGRHVPGVHPVAAGVEGDRVLSVAREVGVVVDVVLVQREQVP